MPATFTSALMNLAIVGTYPDAAIDYPEVLISKGPLPPSKNASAAVSSDGEILFGWEDNSGTGTAKPDVAYFPVEKLRSLVQAQHCQKTGRRGGNLYSRPDS